MPNLKRLLIGKKTTHNLLQQKERETERDRNSQRQSETDRDRQRQKQSETDRDRLTDRDMIEPFLGAHSNSALRPNMQQMISFRRLSSVHFKLSVQ